MNKPFAPGASTANIPAGTTSANVALSANAYAVLVYNSGTVPAFIQFGDSSVTATTAASLPIPPGAWRILAKGSAGYVAAIVASGTATVYFTAGEGL
jgi:hypothetical protein